MDALIGLAGGLARWLLIQGLFCLIGCLALKVLTLGRYPDLGRLRKTGWRHLPDVELIALFGLACIVCLALAAARWR
ncbi:MAG: hypothetical protein GAK35_00142 [Herbaspirillum frisingense]|uniref:Uncharacterized protein n=1 Tax=Herbaspirillum frisingense TaxID=92645 RepID=A0A7V8JWA5_9BURK|nr:MAG: hypothetical protein GAK35_00142 [Herbaspirillum frisingense]